MLFLNLLFMRKLFIVSIFLLMILEKIYKIVTFTNFMGRKLNLICFTVKYFSKNIFRFTGVCFTVKWWSNGK